MTLDEFYDQLKMADTDAALVDFCRRTVLHGTPKVFEGREDDFYAFRKRIAEKFNVSFHEVFVVGSAKLGFSPFKKKEFDYNSDIDVAIISTRLFDMFMESIYGYQMSLRQSRKSVTENELSMYHKFLEYIAIGWLRPDKLPISFSIKSTKTDWFEFFSSISNGRSEVGNYEVTAGVYKNYRYLEEYTISGIRNLKRSLQIVRENG